MITHKKLCDIGAKWLKRNGLIRFNKPLYVVVEIELTGGAQPDIFGFGGCITQQIEVKVSRSDFLSDKRKEHRIKPELDAGMLRSYLCPYGLIKIEELPRDWGLLYYNDGKITTVKEPIAQKAYSYKENQILCSVMRRIGIKSQIFSFKKYKQ